MPACPHCAAEVPEGSAFCPKCGKTVDTPIATPGAPTVAGAATPPANSPPATPPPPAASPSAPTTPFPPTSAAAQAGVLTPPPPGLGGKGKLVAAVGGSAVLIVILAVVGFILLGKDDEPTTPPSTPPVTTPSGGGPTPGGGGDPSGGQPPSGGGEPTEPGGGTPPQGRSIADALPRQVGPFTLQSVERVPALINAGAADAAQGTYADSGGTRVVFTLAGYRSAETAGQHASQVAEGLQRDGFQPLEVQGVEGVQVRAFSKGDQLVVVQTARRSDGIGVLVVLAGPRDAVLQFDRAFGESGSGG